MFLLFSLISLLLSFIPSILLSFIPSILLSFFPSFLLSLLFLTALDEAKVEQDLMRRQHLKLEIEAFKQRKRARLRKAAQEKIVVQDVTKRHYQVKFRELPDEKYRKDKPDKMLQEREMDLEDLNARRKIAKEKRRASMMKLNNAHQKEEEERKKIEEKLRMADNPLDKLSIKLHYELRTNLTKLSDIFSQMDKDGSGSLTYKEFRKGLFNVGIKLNTKETKILCEGLDTDKSGEIEYKEVSRFLAQTKNGEESAAMQIQARIRARKVNTKTLAQKRAEFEAAKAAKFQAELRAKEKAWDEKQARLANDGE